MTFKLNLTDGDGTLIDFWEIAEDEILSIATITEIREAIHQEREMNQEPDTTPTIYDDRD